MDFFGNCWINFCSYVYKRHSGLCNGKHQEPRVLGFNMGQGVFSSVSISGPDAALGRWVLHCPWPFCICPGPWMSCVSAFLGTLPIQTHWTLTTAKEVSMVIISHVLHTTKLRPRRVKSHAQAQKAAGEGSQDLYSERLVPDPGSLCHGEGPCKEMSSTWAF